MTVFLSAGEASGDAYGAALATEIRRLARADIEFAALGGRRMAEAGVEMLTDSSSWGAVSILESLKVVPKVLRGYYAAKHRLRRVKPGLFIPIDFGYANIRLARHAKSLGWRVLYFVPPGSWRRDWQGPDLPAVSDRISTPFSWSANILNSHGANASWFGHPIKQLMRDRGCGVAPLTSERIAALPGSRKHEIDLILPVLAGALDDPIEFALAPSVDVTQFMQTWSRLAPNRVNDRFTSGDVYGVLTRCRAAVVCSGTATLEAALCRCPMIVIYRFPKVAEIEAKLVGFKRPKFVSLPNILADCPIVPELIQQDATVEALREATGRLLSDPAMRAEQIRAFDELDELLGPTDAITKTAEMALEMIISMR